MTTKDEALRLALEALERVNTVDDDCDILSPQLADAVTESIDAIREALAQPSGERGELVAWCLGNPKYADSSNVFMAHQFTPDGEHESEWTALYAPPEQ